MIHRIFIFGFVLNFCANVALACSLNPNAKHDNFLNQKRAIVNAKVLSAEVRQSRESGSCLRLNYSTIETLFGVVPSEFVAEYCPYDVSADELIQMLANDELQNTFGYVAEAEVLLAVVSQDNEQVNFRLAMAACLGGAFHIRLDRFSERERADFISNFKSDIENELDQH